VVRLGRDRGDVKQRFLKKEPVIGASLHLKISLLKYPLLGMPLPA
jgi:hypothetical protein